MAFRPYKPRPYLSTKGVVSRVYNAVDGGLKHIAFLLHRSETQAQSYSDPATPDELTLDQARRLADLSPEAAAILADDFAAFAGGAFLPCAPALESFAALTAHSAEDWGAFTARVLRAQADGTLSAVERRAIRERIDHLIHTLGCARARLVDEPGERPRPAVVKSEASA